MKLQTAKRIFNDLQQEYSNWKASWQQLARYLAPTAGCFDDEGRAKTAKQIDHKTILDSTAQRAVSILSAGMMSGLTSPSRSWFKLALDEENQTAQSNAVKRWLYEIKQTIERVFAKSNLYGVLHNFYEEISVFGVAAFLVEEDFNTVISCRAMTIGEFMLGQNEHGKVDRFARKFYMTTFQLVAEFGLNNVPEKVQREYKNQKYETLHQVNHVIAPNKDRDTQAFDNQNMPFASLYWLEGTDHVLRSGGYHDFPIIAARWEVKRSCDTYGHGPGWNVLGDVKMLQKMQKSFLVALDKSTNPPVLVSNKVQGEVNLLPGGITRFSDSADGAVRPAYQVQPAMQDLDASMQQVRTRISEQFYADMFLMISNIDAGKMTATEVAERTQEKMMMLGPVLERLKNELLDPLIERTFNICLRAGILPPPPEEIQGRDLHVSYISMIAQAQKAGALNTIRQSAAFAQELAQIQLASAQAKVLDNVDFDGALREGMSAMGATPKMIRPEEEVENARQNRAAAQESLNQQAQLAQAVQSAKTLADTPLGTGSALDAITQGVTNNG